MQHQPETAFESFLAALGFFLWVAVMVVITI